MIYFYKGTPKNTGSAGQIWYSTSEKCFFLELLKQSGWDPNKGPNGVGVFKESKKDPKKMIRIKLKLEEACEILNVIDLNRTAVQYNQAVAAENLRIENSASLIKEANKALTPGQTRMVCPLKRELMPLPSFSAFHRSPKNTTQIFFKPWDKDNTQCVLHLIKQDAEDKTESGKVSISILLKSPEIRYMYEYITVGTRDILLYREPEQKIDKKLNIPTEESGQLQEEPPPSSESAF